MAAVLSGCRVEPRGTQVIQMLPGVKFPLGARRYASSQITFRLLTFVLMDIHNPVRLYMPYSKAVRIDPYFLADNNEPDITGSGAGAAVCCPAARFPGAASKHWPGPFSALRGLAATT